MLSSISHRERLESLECCGSVTGTFECLFLTMPGFLTPKSGHTDEDHLKMVGNDVLKNQNRNQEKKKRTGILGHL